MPLLVGILADTHNQVDRTRQVVQDLAARGAACLFHCGDLTGPEIIEVCALLKTYFVFGNNDAERDQLDCLIEHQGSVSLGDGGFVRLAGKTIAVTHGHQKKQVHQLLARRPDYLLTGHSHKVHDERHGATRWINPGALHRAKEWTYGLLDLEMGTLEILTTRT